MPKLTICIPTYNREEYLQKLIDSIIVQDRFTEEVEVFIYDDPSTDNTETLVNEYIKKYPNIRYHRNSVRAGMMPSILDSILQCAGEYVWLFGSDDLISPIGIQTMLNIIQKDTPDLILSNYGYIRDGIIPYKGDLESNSFNGIGDFCNNLTLKENTIPGGQEMDHLIAYFSYMSIYCFRSDVFKNSYQNMLDKGHYEYLQKHYFNYIYILLGSDFVQKIVLCKNPILTYNQSGEVSWRMNFSIIRDVRSIFLVLKHNFLLSRRTKRVFNKIYFTWCRWYVESEIYHFPIIKRIREKHGSIYAKGINVYKSLFK